MTDNKLRKRAFVIFIATLVFSAVTLPHITIFADAQSIKTITIRSDGALNPQTYLFNETGTFILSQITFSNTLF